MRRRARRRTRQAISGFDDCAVSEESLVSAGLGYQPGVRLFLGRLAM
jgi:hypothetical protein